MTTFALVAAADFNKADYLRRSHAGMFDAVVAIDGGYAHLLEAEVEPQVVLGDFDSLGYRPNHPRVITYPEHKDESDLELALRYASQQGADTLYVYGCLSGRLDHTLAAIQTLAAAAEQGLRITAIAAGSTDPKAGFQQGMAFRYLVGPTQLLIHANPEEQLYGHVSVFALNDEAEGVTEQGLAYPLDGATLTNRTSLGLSNQLIGKAATVSVEKGTICVLYPSIFA